MNMPDMEVGYKTLQDVLTDLKALNPIKSEIEISELEADFTLVKKYGKQWGATTAEDIVERAINIRQSCKDSIQDFTPELIALLDRANEVVTKGHRLRVPQIFVLLLSCKRKGAGQVFEVPAGEGKKTLGAMLAAMKILTGEGPVDIVTPSADFAEEAKKKSIKFFKLLGISVALNNEGNGSFLDGTEEAFPDPECDVLYGTLRSFQFNYLRNRIIGGVAHSPMRRSAVILDSIDTLLIDENDTHVCKIPTPFPIMASLHQVYVQIWNGLNLAESTTTANMSAALGEAQADLKHRVEAHELTEEQAFEVEARTREALMEMSYEDIKRTVREALLQTDCLLAQIKDFVATFLDSWTDKAIRAKHCLKEGKDYCLRRGSKSPFVVPINYRTAGQLKSTVWSHELLQFLHLKHKLPLRIESLAAFSISNMSYLKSYQSNLICLTESIGSNSEKRLLQNLYSVQFTKLPPFELKRFEEYEQLMVRDQNWIYEICHLADNISWYKGRAVIIVCRTVRDCNYIEKCFKFMDSRRKDQALHFESLRKFTEEDSEPFPPDHQKLLSGQVVIATVAAAKFIKFKASGDIEKLGGLHLFLCFYPRNVREKVQVLSPLSRNARGSYQEIVRRSEIQDIVGILNPPVTNHSLRCAPNRSCSNSSFAESIWLTMALVNTEAVENARINYSEDRLIEFMLFKDKLFDQFLNFYQENRSQNSDLASSNNSRLLTCWAFWAHQQIFLQHPENAKPDNDGVQNETRNKFHLLAEKCLNEFLKRFNDNCCEADGETIFVDVTPIALNNVPEPALEYDPQDLHLYCREDSTGNKFLETRGRFKLLTYSGNIRAVSRLFSPLELCSHPDSVVLSTVLGLHCMSTVINKLVTSRIDSTELKLIIEFIVEKWTCRYIQVRSLATVSKTNLETACLQLLRKRELHLWDILDQMYAEMSPYICDWRWKGKVEFAGYGHETDFAQFFWRFGTTLSKKLNLSSYSGRPEVSDAPDLKKMIDDLMSGKAYEMLLLKAMEHAERDSLIPLANSWKLRKGFSARSSYNATRKETVPQNPMAHLSAEYKEDDVSNEDDEEYLYDHISKVGIQALKNGGYIDHATMEELQFCHYNIHQVCYPDWQFAKFGQIQNYVEQMFSDADACTRPEFVPQLVALADRSFQLLTGGHRLPIHQVVMLAYVGITRLETKMAFFPDSAAVSQNVLSKHSEPDKEANRNQTVSTISDSNKSADIICTTQHSQQEGILEKCADRLLVVKPSALILIELKELNPKLTSSDLKLLQEQLEVQSKGYEKWKKRLISQQDFSIIAPTVKQLLDTKCSNEIQKRTIPELIGLMERVLELLAGQLLRIPQIICLLELSRTTAPLRQISQVRAGEGKTILIAMLAIIMCLMGETYIDVVTSSCALAKRTVTQILALYQAFGITIGTVNFEDQEPPEETSGSRPRVLYGDLRSFQHNYLRKQVGNISACKVHLTTAIFDEIDELRIRTLEKDVYYLPAPSIPTKSFKRLHYHIWNNLKEAEQEFIKKIERELGKLHAQWCAEDEIVTQKRSYNEWEYIKNARDRQENQIKEELVLESSKAIEALVVEKVRPLLEHLPGPIKDFLSSTLQRRVSNAVLAAYVLERDRDYCLKYRKDQKDVITMSMTEERWRSCSGWGSSDHVNHYTSSWSFGLLQFLQLKHNLEVTPEELPCLRISNMGYINLYKKFSALTHTYGSALEQKFLQQIYGNLRFLNIPTHARLTLEEFEGTVVDDDDFPYDLAFNASKVALHHQRAVLILCKTVGDCRAIQAALTFIEDNPRETNGEANRFGSIRVFTEETEKVPSSPAQILRPGDVVVATMTGIRSLRFFTSSELEASGGLHTIICFLPSSQHAGDEALSTIFRLGNGSYQISLRRTEVEAMIAREGKNLPVFKHTPSVEDTVENEDTSWSDFDLDDAHELIEPSFIESLQMSSQSLESFSFGRLLKCYVPVLKFEDQLFDKFWDYYREQQNKINLCQNVHLKQIWGLWVNSLTHQASQTSQISEMILRFMEYLQDFPQDTFTSNAEIPYTTITRTYNEDDSRASGAFSGYKQQRQDYTEVRSYEYFCNETELFRHSSTTNRYIFQDSPSTLVGVKVLEKAVNKMQESNFNQSGQRSRIRSCIERHHQGFVLIKLITLLANGFMTVPKFQELTRNILKTIEPFLWKATRAFHSEPENSGNEFSKACQEFYKALIDRIDWSTFSKRKLEESEIEQLLDYTLDSMADKAFEMLRDINRQRWNSFIIFEFESFLKSQLESAEGAECRSYVRDRSRELSMKMQDIKHLKTYHRDAEFDRAHLEMSLYLILKALDGLKTKQTLDVNRTNLYELSMFLQTPISVNGTIVEGWKGNDQATCSNVPPQPIELVSIHTRTLMLKDAEDAIHEKSPESYFLQRLDYALQQPSHVTEFLRVFSTLNRPAFPSASQFSHLKSEDFFFLVRESENRLGDSQRVRDELAGRLEEILTNSKLFAVKAGHALKKHENVKAAQSYLENHPDVLKVTTFRGRTSLIEALKRCLSLVRNKRDWLEAGADYEIHVDAKHRIFEDKSFKMVTVQRKEAPASDKGVKRKGAPRSGKAELQYKLQNVKYFTLLVGYRTEEIEGRSRRILHLQSIFPRDERPDNFKGEDGPYCINKRENIPRSRRKQAWKGNSLGSRNKKKIPQLPESDLDEDTFSLFGD